MITWHFKGHEIYFSSEEEKLDRHILQNRNRLQTDAEVVIINENGSTNHNSTADLNSGDSDTTFEDLEALDRSINSPEPEGEKASGLRNLSDNVDGVGFPPADLGNTISNGDAGSTGNSVRRKRSR